MLSQLRGARLGLPREANPVLVRELRSRFRGPRAFVLLTLYLLALTAVAALLLYGYRAGARSGMFGLGMAMGSDTSGALLLASLAGLQHLAITLLGPALTIGALSGEKERQTLELLLATPLSGAAIARGKVLAAMAYVALLVFSALPAISVVFLLGGVSVGALLGVELGLLAIGLLYCALGALFSAVTGRTGLAALLSYGTILAMGFGGWVFAIFGLLIGSIAGFAPAAAAAGSGYLPRLGQWLMLSMDATHPLAWAATFAQSLLLGLILLVTTEACIRPPSRRFGRDLSLLCVLLYLVHVGGALVAIYHLSAAGMPSATAYVDLSDTAWALAVLSPVFPIFLIVAMSLLVRYRWRRAR